MKHLEMTYLHYSLAKCKGGKVVSQNSKYLLYLETLPAHGIGTVDISIQKPVVQML